MKILKFIDHHLEEVFLVIAFIVMTIVTFLQVIMRYVFNSSIFFSEELSRYIFVWITFIGISYGIKRSQHMRVDALYNVIPIKMKKSFDVISTLLFLLFLLLSFIYSFFYFRNIANTAQSAVTMNFHMKWIMLAPVVGFFLSVFRLLQQSVFFRIQVGGSSQVEPLSKGGDGQ